MKYSVTTPDGCYSTKTKEFTSLRRAGEFVRDMPDGTRFVEIRALDVGPLLPLEKIAFENFTEGKIKL